MHKIPRCAAAAVLFFSLLPLSACGPNEGERTRYTVCASFDPDSATLTLTEEVDAVLPFETDTLEFQLWANAYREDAKNAPVSELFAPSAYYAGKSYGGVKISAVGGAEGFEVGGEDENLLFVRLPSKLPAGARATVTLSCEVTLAAIDHRLGVTKTGVNLSGFYPVLCATEDGAFKECLYSSNGDPFVSETADYDVTLTIPSSYTLISGFPADETEEAGSKICHVLAENVRDIAFVLGEGYACAKGEAAGVPVTYYYKSDEDAARTLEAACRSLAFYAETFGAYAYPAYTVVQTGFVYGGMEWPALSMISDRLTAAETPAVVAHETAHQWWYAAVGSDQYGCAWQDEGLAEFSAALFLDGYPEYGMSYRDCVTASERSFRAFFSVTSQLDGAADTTMNRILPAFSGDYEYRNIAYDKGVILFDRVRTATGEKRFMKGLRNYYDDYAGKIASYDDLVSSFERAGANVRPLFSSFVDGKCVI